MEHLKWSWSMYQQRKAELAAEERKAFAVFLASVKAHKRSGGKKYGLSKATGETNWTRINKWWNEAESVQGDA